MVRVCNHDNGRIDLPALFYSVHTDLDVGGPPGARDGVGGEGGLRGVEHAGEGLGAQGAQRVEEALLLFLWGWGAWRF